MSALDDRVTWLDHTHACPTCRQARYLADLCDTGAPLARAVRASLGPGETWKLSPR